MFFVAHNFFTFYRIASTHCSGRLQYRRACVKLKQQPTQHHIMGRRRSRRRKPRRTAKPGVKGSLGQPCSDPNLQGVAVTRMPHEEVLGDSDAASKLPPTESFADTSQVTCAMHDVWPFQSPDGVARKVALQAKESLLCSQEAFDTQVPSMRGGGGTLQPRRGSFADPQVACAKG